MNESYTTAESLLDVGQRLFAERGYDASSVRDITGSAGANVGAVTYHFGSKEALYQAVLERALAPLRETGVTDKRGTKITFKPSVEVFDVTGLNFDILSGRLRELSFLNRGLRICLVDQRGDEVRSVEFYYEGGIVSFVEYLNRAKRPLHESLVHQR